MLSIIRLTTLENEPGSSTSAPPCKKIKLEVTTQTSTLPATPRKIKLKHEVKNLKQKIKRREVKINNLLSILAILKEKCKNYEEVQSVVTNCFPNIHEQLNKNKSNKGTRFSDELKSFALTLYFYSARAYRYLRNFVSIPHPSTLRRLLATHNCNVGFISEVLNYLKGAVKENDNLQNVALIFDAMSIRSEIKYDHKSDKYWGYVDYGGILVNDSETLATEVLIFQIVSFTTKFKCPIAYFLINKISAHIQSQLLLAAIRYLGDINITVRSLTCDGTVTNLKSYELLGCDFSLNDMRTHFKHPQKDSKVHCLLDPPHMIKLSRNVFAETKMSSEKGEINFEFVKKLHNLQDQEGLRLANKLSSTHVNFEGKKMNVRLATQVLSSSVADSIDFLRCSGNLNFAGSEATVEFIRTMDRIFDLFNCKLPFGKGFKSPMRIGNMDVWMNILNETREYLYKLKVNGCPMLQHRRKTPCLGLIIDTFSFSQLALDLLQEGILKYFLTYKCSQDHLEMFFSCLRAAGGHNDNPSALQVKYALRKLLFRNSVTPSVNANSFDADFETAPVLEFKSNKHECNSVFTTETNEEQQIEWLLDIVNGQNLSEYKNNILYYISGFIVKKFFEKSNCEHCKAALVSNENQVSKEHGYAIDLNNYSAFTMFIDRGGLKHASTFVFLVVQYTEKVFITLAKDSLLKTNRHKIMIMIQQHFYDNLESLIVPPHPINSFNCETRHEINLLKFIANKYLTMRMATYGKDQTFKAIGTSRATLRQKLHKTILFSNV